MKMHRACLLLGTLTLLAANPSPAQTPPSLGLRLFAGVNLAGTVSSVCVVQANSDLSQTNGWTSLAFEQLPSTNFLFVDTTQPVAGNRFYRALLQDPPTNMVFIPPSTFRRGSPTNETGRAADEGPPTAVTMEGNVLEWCLDWYGPYPGGFEIDPQGPASNVTGVKVIRGGAWDGFESDCRSARRQTFGVSPFLKDFILGFRVVLAAP